MNPEESPKVECSNRRSSRRRRNGIFTGIITTLQNLSLVNFELFRFDLLNFSLNSDTNLK